MGVSHKGQTKAEELGEQQRTLPSLKYVHWRFIWYTTAVVVIQQGDTTVCVHTAVTNTLDVSSGDIFSRYNM
jgi:hypothetical protein